MRLLGLDSSAIAASCAITDGGRVLASASVNRAITHSQTLLPLLENTLRAANLTFADIDAFAVNSGPGSFTGLRISVSAVKGLAFALNKPVCGVSTLLSLGYNLAGQDVTACAVMDARRGEVYNAMFTINRASISGDSVTRLTPDRAISLADLDAELQQYPNAVLVGDGAELACERFGGRYAIASEITRFQNAASVCFAANPKEFITAKELMPRYIRLPQAERERVGRDAPGAP
jgi:tRNA threonylcarbamoyladenosine biosynthesis protein TsaB